MPILKADNRTLTASEPYSYLTTNYASGVTSVVVSNSDGFASSDYMIVGEIGHELTELIKITTVTGSTDTFTIPATKYAHPESTRVTKVSNNQVRFFYTATESFDELNPVTGWQDLTPDSWFSQAEDTASSTGYGWFRFRNETTAAETNYSNPIPYANFLRSTAKSILDGFYSSMNSNDLQLITLDDAFEWMNEAHDEVRAELGMAVNDVDASDGTDSISVVAGTAEYALASDFSEMISIFFDDNGRMMDPISLSEVDKNNSTFYGVTETRFYIRGLFVGFSPVPTAASTVLYRYLPDPTEITAYSDVIDLPKKGFNSLKDWMMFRAKQKLGHANAMQSKELFDESVAKLVARLKNRDNSVDSWGMAPGTNV